MKFCLSVDWSFNIFCGYHWYHLSAAGIWLSSRSPGQVSLLYCLDTKSILCECELKMWRENFLELSTEILELVLMSLRHRRVNLIESWSEYCLGYHWKSSGSHVECYKVMELINHLQSLKFFQADKNGKLLSSKPTWYRLHTRFQMFLGCYTISIYKTTFVSDLQDF